MLFILINHPSFTKLVFGSISFDFHFHILWELKFVMHTFTLEALFPLRTVIDLICLHKNQNHCMDYYFNAFTCHASCASVAGSGSSHLLLLLFQYKPVARFTLCSG